MSLKLSKLRQSAKQRHWLESWHPAKFTCYAYEVQNPSQEYNLENNFFFIVREGADPDLIINYHSWRMTKIGLQISHTKRYNFRICMYNKMFKNFFVQSNQNNYLKKSRIRSGKKIQIRITASWDCFFYNIN